MAAEGWVVSFDDWKMRDKRALVKAINQSQVDGDDSALDPFMTRAIKAWPFAGDPAVVESYEELTMLEYKEAAAAVVDALKSYLK